MRLPPLPLALLVALASGCSAGSTSSFDDPAPGRPGGAAGSGGAAGDSGEGPGGQAGDDGGEGGAGAGGEGEPGGSAGAGGGQGGEAGAGGEAGQGGEAGAGGGGGDGGPGGGGGAAGGDAEGGAGGEAGAGGDAGASGGVVAGGAAGAGAGGEAGAGGAGAGGAGAGGAGQGGSAGSAGGLPECQGTQTAEVFAHSGGALFRVDPDTKAVVKVANFSGCDGSVIDIAIDREGLIYGTTFSSLVKIDRTTATCTTIKGNGSYPNSLSFVPAGTIYPDKEALVGYNASTYVLIDPVTGQVSTKGKLSGGYTSSGDIVSVIGGGTYLTVKGGGCSTDCVLRVDPSTGDLLENLGQVGKTSVFGLAYWAGFVYGFNDGGELFTFDVKTKQVTDVPIPNAPSGLSFYGAGSTTCAPVDKP